MYDFDEWLEEKEKNPIRERHTKKKEVEGQKRN